jgi:hypothetical protein
VIQREWLQTDTVPSCNGPACPIGIGLGPDANLWFTEFDGNKIGRITDVPRTRITLTPRSGPPGTTVQVSGTGFGALEGIDLAFRDLQGRLVPLGSTAADGGGLLSMVVVIPSGASPGRQAIVARGAISHVQTSSPFLVT